VRYEETGILLLDRVEEQDDGEHDYDDADQADNEPEDVGPAKHVEVPEPVKYFVNLGWE